MRRLAPDINQNSRALRKELIDAERALWRHLRNRQMDGARFRRQHPLHRFIVDFVCLEARVIIELDGGQHSLQQEYDKYRTELLEQMGFKVLRFWNDEVLHQIESVKEVIWTNLPARKVSSPWQGED